MSKRKSIEDGYVENSKKIKRDESKSESEKYFNGYKFYIHNAAVSKTRRAIFERQIPLKGGVLLKCLDDFKRHSTADQDSFILVEDKLISGDKLNHIVEKLQKDTETESRSVIVGLTWVSQCIETKGIVDKSPYVLTKCLKNKDKSAWDNKCKTKVIDKPSVQLEVGESKASTSNIIVASTSSSSSSDATSWTERNKDKFVCAQSSKNPSISKDNHNMSIVRELEKLAEAYKNSSDTWRALGYRKAIVAINSHPSPITSHSQARSIRGVGDKMADKVMEIVESGRLRKVEEVCNTEKMKVMELFTGVWGAGSVTAETWYQQGHRTLSDLTSGAKLTKQQQVGVRLYRDLNTRMGRQEAARIEEVVRREAMVVRPGLEVTACGSYRRGKETCGDLDVLITHPDGESHVGVFDSLVKRLTDSSFLTDHLSFQKDGNQRKYLGVCRLPGEESLHRRLDIIVVPWRERAPAIMYFTGSAHFNRSMRLLATKLGMSLSEHSLRGGVVREGKEKMNEGFVMETPTEESIFEHLGLKYREPNERDH